jgi:cysteinyl-tRNA synthetase
MNKQIKIIILFFIILAVASMSGQVLAQSNYESTAEMRLLNNELKAKKKQLDTIKEEQEKYNILIEEFQNEQSTLENQVAILENRVSKAQLDISELELEIDGLNLEIRKLGLDIQAKDTKIENATKCGTLMAMDEVLDIGLSESVSDGVRSLGVIAVDELPTEIQELVDKREAARVARNWAEADMLRENITLKGYTLEDSAHGPKVTKTD